MTEDELRDLIERQSQIEDMQQHSGWAYLRDYVTHQVQAKNRYLLNGHAETIEKYRAEAGWIQGALFVLEAGERLKEQIEHARERIEEAKAAEA